jgi:hypothetical protein
VSSRIGGEVEAPPSPCKSGMEPCEGTVQQVQFAVQPALLRRRFLQAFWGELRIIWPILSALLVIQLALGALIAYLEKWPLGNAAYFTFVTGLTIGYGDLVPSHFITRLLAVVIGFIGILLTGLIAAVGVQALRAARRDATDQWPERMDRDTS